MRILITEPMSAAAVQRLAERHEVVHDATWSQRPDELIAAARDADAIVVANRTQVRGALLDALVRCRAVGRLGVGLDNIDVDGCRARGIAVLPATGANARSVAEYVIAAALLLRRPGSFDASDATAAGQWPRRPAREGAEIGGATLGVVGFGGIGQLTAQLAQALGMRVVAHSRRAPAERLPGLDDVPLLPLPELLASSDVVTLHVPLTDGTRHLIDADALARMRPGAVLINTARGGVVDNVALLAALRSGHLRGAAIDVFDTEPLPPGSVFADRPANLLLTPHVGSATEQSESRVGHLVADKVLAALDAAASPAAVSRTSS